MSQPKSLTMTLSRNLKQFKDKSLFAKDLKSPSSKETKNSANSGKNYLHAVKAILCSHQEMRPTQARFRAASGKDKAAVRTNFLVSLKKKTKTKSAQPHSHLSYHTFRQILHTRNSSMTPNIGAKSTSKIVESKSTFNIA